jgi:cytidine deaminase
MNIEILLEKAKKVRELSYSPYSHFKVGCAIELVDGQIIVGTNIENAAFSETICAERNALTTAYALGYRQKDILRLLVVADTKTLTSPCGACRQVISELCSPDAEVIIANLESKHLVLKVADLLPYVFSAKNLENA